MSQLDHALQQSKRNIQAVAENLELARRELEQLRKERKRLDAEMKVTDIAEFFDKDRTTIHRWLKEGKLKSKKIVDVLNLKKNR